jgi:porin
LNIRWFVAAVLLASSAAGAWAQQDKKTDDEKPADPDTGESTVEESTLGLLPNPLQKYGIKFAATYIGETQGNVSGGLKQGAIYDGRLNLAVDVDLQKLEKRAIPIWMENSRSAAGGISASFQINVSPRTASRWQAR